MTGRAAPAGGQPGRTRPGPGRFWPDDPPAGPGAWPFCPGIPPTGPGPPPVGPGDVRRSGPGAAVLARARWDRTG